MLTRKIELGLSEWVFAHHCRIRIGMNTLENNLRLLSGQKSICLSACTWEMARERKKKLSILLMLSLVFYANQANMLYNTALYWLGPSIIAVAGQTWQLGLGSRNSLYTFKKKGSVQFVEKDYHHKQFRSRDKIPSTLWHILLLIWAKSFVLMLLVVRFYLSLYPVLCSLAPCLALLLSPFNFKNQLREKNVNTSKEKWSKQGASIDQSICRSPKPLCGCFESS